MKRPRSDTTVITTAIWLNWESKIHYINHPYTERGKQCMCEFEKWSLTNICEAVCSNKHVFIKYITVQNFSDWTIILHYVTNCTCLPCIEGKILRTWRKKKDHSNSSIKDTPLESLAGETISAVCICSWDHDLVNGALSAGKGSIYADEISVNYILK